MNKEEIQKIKEEVKSYKQPDIAAEEESLYTMSKSEGWKVFVKKANKMIVDYLEPIESKSISPETNLEMVGAIAIARSEKISAIRHLINEVESIRIVKDEIKRREDEQKKEKSEHIA